MTGAWCRSQTSPPRFASESISRCSRSETRARLRPATSGQRASGAPGTMVGGRTLNALPGNLCSTLSHLVVDAAYACYNADPDNARFFASNNLAVPTRRFLELGGFDPEFTTAEDRDLCARWLESGG